MANKKITDLNAVTTLNNADLFACVSGVGTSPVTQSISVGNLRSVIGSGNTIIAVSSNAFTTTVAANTNLISFSDTVTSGIEKGDIVSFAQGGVTSFYLVTNVVTDTSVTVAGPLISNLSPIGDITVYSKSRSITTDVVFSGAYAIGGSTATLINRETRSVLRWNAPKAYFVFAAARNNQADGTSPAQINISIARSGSLSTRNNMLTSAISLSGNSWVTTDRTVDSSHYVVEFGDEIEVNLVNAGGDGDSRDLTVSLVFGLEF
jgi:hypothetical protein